MTCPQCQNANETRAVFCDQCGARFAQPEQRQHRGVETSFIVFWVATLIMVIAITILVSKDPPLKWRRAAEPTSTASPDQ